MTTEPQAAGIDYQAVATRLEAMIDALTRYYVADGFKVDRQVGEAAIDYCRRRASGKIGRSPRAEHKMLDFITRHDVPLDWIIEGDLKSLFTRLAAVHHGTKARAAA